MQTTEPLSAELINTEGPKMTDKMADKIAQLEMAITFQDDALEAVQNTLMAQHHEIQTLKTQIKLLSEYLKTVREESIRSTQDELPPPHY
jgi:SlyX protein